MRLSWYADTGVAVFSIWQGGTCTGTFRLPIADLPRMVDALQHGPRGRGAGLAGEDTARTASHPRTPAPSPPPDSDIATGETAWYLPPGAEVTGYHMEPPAPGRGVGGELGRERRQRVVIGTAVGVFPPVHSAVIRGGRRDQLAARGLAWPGIGVPAAGRRWLHVVARHLRTGRQVPGGLARRDVAIRRG